jgi:hypothetical protein
MSGFAERCTWALLILIGLDALALLLGAALSATGVLAPVGGVFILAAALLPLLLLGWAFAGRPFAAVFVAVLLGALIVAMAVVVWAALLRFYGGGGGDEEGLMTDVLALPWIAVALGVILPLLVMLAGSVVHLISFKTGRIAIAIVLLSAAALALSPLVHTQLVGAGLVRAESSPAADRARSAPPTPVVTRTPQPVPTSAPEIIPCRSRPTALMGAYIAAQYNPDVGLYREAPNVAPNTYWVYSDGYLAGADISRWDVPVLTKWTILVEGAVVDEKELTYSSYDINVGNGVRAEAPDRSQTLPDWDEYADRLLFAAINAQNAGNWSRSTELVARANSMWNGKGMDDKFHQVTGMYQTYHVALYYYASTDLRALEALLKLQETNPVSNRYGGIYTEYGEDGRPFPGTDTNVETTAATLHVLGERCFVGTHFPSIRR